MNVNDAIKGRRSVRGFLSDPVSKEIIEKIIEDSSWAPSGSNTQPWKVYAVSGLDRDRLCDEVTSGLEKNPNDETPQYQYYPVKWREPYLTRRRETGWGLYSTLGISKGEREKAFKQQLKNYDLFGAPVGLFFTMDNDLELGSWLDCGMFIQNIMISSRGFGLETCPQAAWVYHHELVRKVLPIPESEILICGLAIGYEDKNEVANTFRPGRQKVNEFTKFLGF